MIHGQPTAHAQRNHLTLVIYYYYNYKLYDIYKYTRCKFELGIKNVNCDHLALHKIQ